MYIIKMIEPYFTNKRKVISKMKKIYFCSLGLETSWKAILRKLTFRNDNGAIFENFVMLELWQKQKPGGTLQFTERQTGQKLILS